ncbi:hypothetical protein ACWIYZ_04965 [Ursidibacter arcticus]
MAFVTCGQHKKSQDAQDAEIEKLKKADEAKTQSIKDLAENALSAEDALVDKSGAGANGKGKITADKIKEAIGGDVAVTVKEKSGIAGNGTKSNPLALNLGDTLKVGEDGKVNVNTNGVGETIGESLAGSGISFNKETKKLDVGTVRLVDASGTVVLGHLVDKGV